MDQNSSNDADKRNWRERLGIGSKEMPRISGEFTKTPEEAPEAVVTVARGAQPVAKPAPMAPRLPMKSGTTPAAQVARPQQQMPPQGGGSPQAPDALAEKLRSQRAAAERLAEQRVSAAKQRAESSPTVAPVKPLVTPAEKPKFTFADEEAKVDFGREPRALPPGRSPQRPMPQQPQLSPPRPPLGGQPRLPAGASSGFQPQYRPQAPRGYSPSAYVPPPLSQPKRSLNGPMSQPPASEPRLQSSRVNPDAYRRGPQDDLGYAGAGYEAPLRTSQRPGALRGQVAYDEDYGDEIFEEAPPSRSSRRASANDYNQAYRENEGAYGESSRRSSGPWLLLLFLMLAAGAAGASVWYYQTNVKSVATNASTDSAPVVAAPEQSAKSAPQQPLDGQSNTTGSAPSKKQIYDRIIGDNEVLGGQVVPTEEAPIQPEAQQGDAEQIPQPAGSLDAFSEGGDALPLPMPPPPGTGNDTQGAVSTPSGNKTVALSTPATTTNSTGLAVETEIAPVPGENAAAANTEQATPPAATAPAKEEITNVEPESVVIKKAVKKTKSTAETSTALGSEPVVLVPPSDSAAAGQNVSTPLVVDQPVATPPAPVVKKKKTLLGLFKGTNDQAPATQPMTTAPPAPEQQVAALPESAPVQQQAAPTQVASAGSGYFVQLASFKTEAEASAEFGRLKAKHASILASLPSAVNPATVGGSTRYRLAVGPLSSREQATRICSSLVAAGERDCLVRKQ